MSNNYIGQRFNNLTVIGRNEEKDYKYHKMMVCKCDCGSVHESFIGNLRSGNTHSCPSCAAKNRSKHRVKPYRRHRVRNVYFTMIARCHNENSKSYKSYGGAGIKVCERWRDSLDNFIADMGLPKKGQSIDRIDPGGDYEPLNCRWADTETQANNKKNTKLYEYNGESLSLSQWCRKLNLNYDRVKSRINVLGMDFEKAISQGKLNRKKEYIVDGVIYDSLQVIADKYGMSVSGVHGRINSKFNNNWLKITN